MDEEECDCEEGAPAWMATFSDLATLLLTFFVLLLSFAELDVVEFKELLGSVREAFGVQFRTQGHYEALSSSPVSIGEAPPGALTHIDAADLTEAIRKELEDAGVEQNVDVEATPDGIVVRIRDKVLFGTGSATLQSEAEPVLQVIASIAAGFGEQGVAIEGHTDDRPIHTQRFPSNWELSTARATQVLRFLLDHTDLAPNRVSASGYADTRPVAPNDSHDNRGLNRRVEFLFKTPPPPPPEEGEEGEREATGPPEPERRIVQPNHHRRLMPAPRQGPEERTQNAPRAEESAELSEYAERADAERSEGEAAAAEPVAIEGNAIEGNAAD